MKSICSMFDEFFLANPHFHGEISMLAAFYITMLAGEMTLFLNSSWSTHHFYQLTHHFPTFPPFSHLFPTFPRPGSRFSVSPVSPVACSQAKRRATTSLGEVTSVGRSKCPACRSDPRESLVIIITMVITMVRPIVMVNG